MLLTTIQLVNKVGVSQTECGRGRINRKLQRAGGLNEWYERCELQVKYGLLYFRCFPFVMW